MSFAYLAMMVRDTEGNAMNIDVTLGSGLHQLRLAYQGREAFMVRMPLVGKLWNYGAGGSGRASWARVQEEHAQGLED